MFAPGRFVMTCCEADITFMGLPCRFVGAEGLKARSWVMVKAEVEVRYHSLYRGVGPNPERDFDQPRCTRRAAGGHVLRTHHLVGADRGVRPYRISGINA